MPKVKSKEEREASDAPSVRLALGAEVVKSVGEKAFGPSETVRLAYGDSPPERNGTSGIEAPSVRPAGQTDGGINKSVFPTAFADALNKPALLVSFWYLEPFLKNKVRYHFRDWVMDSGAFSAHNSGAEIDLQEYIECCQRLLTEDPQLTEVFALDVIGDWKAGLKNTEVMWRAGIPAIPCFHYGEPWPLLKSLCKDYPKVAIGGCVGKRDKDKFAGQCFARVWPHKLHGFGFGSETSIMLYPWHSVDATNWEIAPCKYGTWKAFGGQRVSVRGCKQNLRAEVEWYLELERKARVKWKKEMKLLGELDAPRDLKAPSIRLAADAASGSGEPLAGTLAAPTIRLVGAADDVTERRPTAFAKRGKK